MTGTLAGFASATYGRGMTAGYAHPAYAASLEAFGRPRELPECGGWVLERDIPGARQHDAMGCYPLFACRDWSALDDDLAALESELISLSLVTDPFGAFDVDRLRDSFPDAFVAFKEHFTIDLAQQPETFVSSHHQRYARKAARVLDVEVAAEPDRWADDWTALYAALIARHGIRGIAAFSEEALSRQLAVPDLVMLRASEGGTTVGMTLWYVQGDVGYYHLGAYSDRGYESRASFALFWHAIGHFRALGVSALSLGAGAGLQAREDDGLSRFKRGWSNGSRTVYFCGRILHREGYARLSENAKAPDSGYFPAYRAGEFS